MRGYILIIIFIITALSACNHDDEAIGRENVDVKVDITLNIGGGEQQTRATAVAPDDNPDIDIEGGHAFEDYIAPNDIKLLVYDQNENFVEEMFVVLTNNSNDNSEDKAEEYTCRVIGSLNNISKADIESGKMYHFVVLCNMDGTLKGNNSYNRANLTSLINGLTYYGYNASFTENLIKGNADHNQTTRIPMWGICTTSLTAGEVTSIDIYVLRTVAKVRVKLDDNLSGYTMTGVTLNIANNGGTMAAQTTNGVAQAYKKTANGSNNVYATAWNNATETPIMYASTYYGGTVSNIPFVSTIENGQRFWTIYIPEYNNIADVINGMKENDTQQAYMTLSINDKNGNLVKYDEQLPKLHFADYSSATYPTAPQWDIIRNEIYEYVITDITGADGLESEVRVVRWFKYRHPGIVM